MSNASEPFEPLISHWNALRRPSANRVASIVPTAPFSNPTAASIASSTSLPGRNVWTSAETVEMSPTRNRARSTTWAPRSPSAPEPAAVGVEAPRVEARVVAPVLQVAASEVADLAELAGLDDLARQAHGGDEAVVEGAEVLDARCRDALPDVVALVGVPAERLLAEDVLAGLRRGDRRLGVERVRATVVEEPDRRIADDVAPVGRPALVAVPSAAAPRPRPRPDRRSPRALASAAVATSCTRSSGTRSNGPCP